MELIPNEPWENDRTHWGDFQQGADKKRGWQVDVDGKTMVKPMVKFMTLMTSRMNLLSSSRTSPTLRPSESKWTGTTTISIGGSDCCMMRPGEANGSKWIAAFAHHYEFAILKSCCKRSWSLVPWYSLVLCHLIWWFRRFYVQPYSKNNTQLMTAICSVARWLERTNTKQFYS